MGKVIVGDIVEIVKNNPEIVVVHGCNCFHTMGAGVARKLSKAFPMVLNADRKTKYGDQFKLGTYSATKIPNRSIIVNAYTQYKYGNGIKVDYNSIREVFKSIKRDFGDSPIYYPKIGSGLGGGDWSIIKDIIDEELEGCDHTLIKWDAEN